MCLTGLVAAAEVLNFVDGNLILGGEKETRLTINEAKKFLSGYLEHAASTYFNASPNSEV